MTGTDNRSRAHITYAPKRPSPLATVSAFGHHLTILILEERNVFQVSRKSPRKIMIGFTVRFLLLSNNTGLLIFCFTKLHVSENFLRFAGNPFWQAKRERVGGPVKSVMAKLNSGKAFGSVHQSTDKKDFVQRP